MEAPEQPLDVRKDTSPNVRPPLPATARSGSAHVTPGTPGITGTRAPQAHHGIGAPPDPSLDRLQTVWAGSRDGLWDWDVGAETLRLSPRWKEILGYTDAEVESRPDEWFRRVHPHDLDEFRRAMDLHIEGRVEFLEREFRMLHKDGSWRWILCRGAKHPTRPLIGGSVTDVTSEKVAEKELLAEAFHDPLTGLPNKRLFLDRLGMTLARRHQRPGPPIAVLYLDLDRFHTVNDSLGVDAGDELLVEVTTRLTGLLRLGDTLGRMGGDKFAVLLDGIASARESLQFAEAISGELKRPLHLAGLEIFAQGSMGISISSSGEERPEDLVRDALTAMHRAKEDGSTAYELFDPEMNANAHERLKLEADLYHAVERNELVLHYQPVVDLASGRLTAFEALVRWEHPDRGLIRPDAFIPIAEETGLIVPIGRWVLERGCRQMRAWRDEYEAGRDVRMAINLSARQFESESLVTEVAECLEASGLEPQGLDLEMTESVVMARTKANAATLQSLRDLGIKLLIDDFGTGYSSLASLQSFPLDALKIDRSFVMGMELDDGKAEIVRTVLALAKSLGLEVVAEGIETAEALAMLRELDCDNGQGYFFSPPVDGESAQAWLADPPRW
jgi:diguanylate cyclase (GGDEF)-like protein/PAS domain S-box-containing protein